MTKQVIVIRKDLKMRRGKEIAQGSHASMKFIVDELQEMGWFKRLLYLFIGKNYFDKDQQDWMFNNAFKKVCVVVNSEEELLTVHETALKLGLTSKLITDSGHTEFKNVPTNTCIAIGPHHEIMFTGVTDKLKLY
jgi:peptidyl-tRNA hydrolase